MNGTATLKVGAKVTSSAVTVTVWSITIPSSVRPTCSDTTFTVAALLELRPVFGPDIRLTALDFAPGTIVA